MAAGTSSIEATAIMKTNLESLFCCSLARKHAAKWLHTLILSRVPFGFYSWNEAMAQQGYGLASTLGVKRP